MEGPRERLARVDATSRNRGSRLSSMLSFSCAPSGPGPVGGSPRRRASTAGAALESTSRAVAPSPRPPSSQRTATPSALDRGDLDAGAQLRARPLRRPSSAPVTAPIPPTGTSQSPVPLPITWYRKQRFWRRSASCAPANVPISASVRHDPALEVVGEVPLQALAQRPLDQRVPGRVVGHPRPQAAAEISGSVKRGEDRAPGAGARARALQASLGARSRSRRSAAGVRTAARVPARGPRRVGGQPPRRRNLAARARRDRPREQADEVRVARQPRVDAGPRALGHGRAADVVAALEHEHRAPRAGQVRGRDQAVVAAADDHRVVSAVLRHQSANRWRVDRHQPVDIMHIAVEVRDDDRVHHRRSRVLQPLHGACIAVRRARETTQQRHVRPCAPSATSPPSSAAMAGLVDVLVNLLCPPAGARD